VKRLAAESSSDFSHLPKKYLGKWIAVKDHKVIASGRTLGRVLAESERQGIDEPIIIKVPKADESYLLGVS
jgi:hypothetical protein